MSDIDGSSEAVAKKAQENYILLPAMQWVLHGGEDRKNEEAAVPRKRLIVC